jgi:hypothetical protein
MRKAISETSHKTNEIFPEILKKTLFLLNWFYIGDMKTGATSRKRKRETDGVMGLKRRKRKTGFTVLSTAQAPTASSKKVERGLFAREDVPVGVEIPYYGEELTENEWKEKYSPIEAHVRVSISSMYIKRMKGDEVIIADTRESRSADIDGLSGKIISQTYYDSKYIVEIEPFREANHTLFVLREKKYIDASIPVESDTGKINVLLGLAPYVNSAEEKFNLDKETIPSPNAKYIIRKNEKIPVIITTHPLKKGEEVIVKDYKVEEID